MNTCGRSSLHNQISEVLFTQLKKTHAYEVSSERKRTGEFLYIDLLHLRKFGPLTLGSLWGSQMLPRPYSGWSRSKREKRSGLKISNTFFFSTVSLFSNPFKPPCVELIIRNEIQYEYYFNFFKIQFLSIF